MCVVCDVVCCGVVCARNTIIVMFTYNFWGYIFVDLIKRSVYLPLTVRDSAITKMTAVIIIIIIIVVVVVVVVVIIKSLLSSLER